MKRMTYLTLLLASPTLALAAMQIQPQLQIQAVTPQVQYVDWQKQAQDLAAKNKTLKAENTDLKERILQMTSKGGHLVQAYCPTSTSSMNTAGESSDCGSIGYTCEPVSGLCRTSCQSSDMCSRDYRCNIEAARCEKAY